MAVQYLYFTHTGTIGGGSWFLYNSSNLRASTTNSSDSYAGPRHNTSTSSGRSSGYAADNMSPPGTVSLVQCYHRSGRTGVTWNSTFRGEHYNGSAWVNEPLRSPVTAWFTDTITAPSGGWDQTKVDAIQGRYYYNYYGAGDPGKKLFRDYHRWNVTYTPFGGSVTIWLPFLAGLVLPTMEAFKEAVHYAHNLARFKRIGNWKQWGDYDEDEWHQMRGIWVNRKYFDMGGVQCQSLVAA